MRSDSTMIIYLKSYHSIEGEICYNPSENRFRFSVPLKDKSPVIVDIIPNEKRVETFSEFEISTEMWNVIHNDLDLKDIPEKIQNDILKIHSNISESVKKVLRPIKYCLKCIRLDENLISNTRIYWSRYKSNWKPLRDIIYCILDDRGLWQLNKKTATDIQKYIHNDFKLFFALRHLHRAINENNPRYKWIDATIAAELAIKEFLIRREPCIETILLEVPAPPLHKLYGSILKKYNDGEKSPKVNELQKGAAIRNNLIHKPDNTKISLKEANEYVHDVETAIYHLLYLLYQEDYKSYKYFPRYK